MSLLTTQKNAWFQITLFFLIGLLHSTGALAALDPPHNSLKFIGCSSCHDLASSEPKHILTMGHTPQDIDDTLFNNLCWSCHVSEGTKPFYVETHSSKMTSTRYGNWAVECWTCHNQHTQEQPGGKFIQAKVNLADITNASKSGIRNVVFAGSSGANSFADGNGVYDGICEVCHTLTTHFRNDGSGSDQLHTNMGVVAGTDCTTCHSHSNGFAHGGGSGIGCEECHGHDPGYGGVTGGAGTYKSHSTHTENDIDDLRGPNVNCDACHDINNFPYFKTGTDRNGDGRFCLQETDVCNTCHSPAGTYDGVDHGDIGAKYGSSGTLSYNWRTRIYDDSDNKSLLPGNEKWCAACHDETASIISTVTAPNVIGDEDGFYTYGTGWGYYKTGHGLQSGEPYPSKGGLIPPLLISGVSRPVHCGECHDSAAAHIDGIARTYDDGGSGSLDPSVYRQGYRLNTVAAGIGTGITGKEPLLVPLPLNAGNNVNQYRLCANCHEPVPAFLDKNDLTSTNLVTTWGGDGTQNRHATHLNMNSTNWASDWNGVQNSRITCMSCHNVHGSRRLAMVRDGKLTGMETPGAEEGLLIWYKNDSISVYNTGNPDPPTPEDIPLSASDGTIWSGESSTNLCSHCHGNINTIPEDRVPFQNVAQAPSLDWTGEAGFVSDGASPDSGPGGSSFEFRVQYTDTNNAPPAQIEVWVDIDDNSTYELGEQFNMTEVNPGDTNYTDGKLYSMAVTIGLAGDNVLSYTFYASDGTSDATGPPTGESSIVVFPGGVNNVPLLEWVSGACRFEGVSPKAELSGTSFDFYVSYTDADNECPPGANDIQVWIDEDDSGTYEPGEKHDLSEVDAGDTICSDGKLYSYSQSLVLSGDNTFNYRFAATDGTDSAGGEPAGDHEVSVIDASAARTVCPGGTCDYTVIQNALNAVTDGWILLVYPGTYNEHLTFDGNDDNTTLVSSCGRDETFINGTGTGSVIYHAWANFGSTVDGFGITNGVHGVQLHGGQATVKNSSIYGNNAGAGVGGGVWSDNGNDHFTLVNSEIYANSGANGAGLYSNQGDIDIIDSIIRNNTATGDGGGIYLDATTISSATRSSFKDNRADGRGGAMFLKNGTGQVNVDKATITGNSSGGLGGAIYKENSISPAFTNTIISNNSAGSSGGAVVNRGTGTFSLVNTTLADNTAVNGGAIWTETDSLTIRNTIFWNNSASAATLPGHNIYKSGGAGSIGTLSDSDVTTTDTTYFVYATWSDGTGIISPAADPKFVGGGDYHILFDSAVIDQASAAYAPTDDIDGNPRPQGTADDMGADEYYTTGSGGTNTVPTLSWTGEPDYTVDGVNPDNGNSGSTFIFRIDYTDADNDAPVLIQVWVDEDANGVYSASEKYSLTIDGGDGDYTNGERYTKSMILHAAGGNSLRYRFYATDGTDDGTGPPVLDKTVTVINNIPTLDWTGEPNYTTDGVDPDNAAGGSPFTFRIEYTDADNTAPTTMQVWIDTDDSSTYEPGEKTDLTISGGDGDYTNGEIFSATVTLASIGDGLLTYRFYAADGADPATGAPTSDKVVTVTAPIANNAPILSWTTADCLTNGVRPETGAEDTDFEFQVSYTDADNQCADIIQVWIDKNDNGTIESSEKYNLTELVPADTDCTDGKTYAATTPLALAGDGTLDYRFFATDGHEAATGTPASTAAATVIGATKVRPAGGPGWYTTIQEAVDYSGDPSTILVYPNGDFTAAAYLENIVIQSKNNRTLRSVCGADLTTIAATGGSAVLLQSSNVALDGFTITGGDTGVYVNLGNPITVQNNKIHTNNSYGMYVNNGAQVTIDNNEIYGNSVRGIHTNPSTTSVHITDCDIHNNGLTGVGAGIYFNGGVQTITNSVIRDNVTTGDGAGIYFNATAAGTTLTNITIRGNRSTDAVVGRGGGLHISNGSQVTIDKCTITDNQSSASVGGGMYITNDATSVVMTNSIVAVNQATRGGAAYLHSGTVSFINNTFADNQATAGNGGAFATCNLVNTTIRNSLFWNNTATGSGNNAYKECGAALFMTVTDSDISTGPGFIDGGTITAGSNIDPAVDPIFIGSGDYHLQAGSPVIDQANASYAPADDIDGDVRPQGPADDIGADEYVP